jgi:hypothetical protein
MVITGEIKFQRGLPESFRANATALYDQAFGPKFSVAIRSKQGRLSLLLEDCFVPEYAIVVTAGDELAGLVGFHTSKGSFTGGLSNTICRLPISLHPVQSYQ